MFRGTYKFDNFYFNYHIEANQVNFPPFSRFELRTPDVHRSVPPNVHLGTVEIAEKNIKEFETPSYPKALSLFQPNLAQCLLG